MKKGFTLIELLVVVLIIGILSAIALPQYMKAVEKSRATEAIQLLGDLATAERIYHMSAGTYTTDMDLLDLTMPGIVANNTTTANTNNFQIVIKTATASQFVASAQRVQSGTTTPATGDQAYAIMAGVNASGTLMRWCADTPATAGSSVLSSFTTTNKTCKSIANNATGQIK